MGKKKQSKDWYIAVTHLLTSGFLIFILNLVVIFLAIFLFRINLKNNTTVFVIITSVIWILSIWPAVMYSARYINKAYIVQDSENIAKLSTMYFGILGGVFRLIVLFTETALLISIMKLAFFAIGVSVFYTLSKMYIKNVT